MDDWDLDEKPLSKWQQLQNKKIYIIQGTTKSVMCTFSVGDTTRAVDNSIEQHT